jgi:hypothetical protein
MSAVKNHFHDEISNRCETCGVMLSEQDTEPCDAPLCPIPAFVADKHQPADPAS